MKAFWVVASERFASSLDDELGASTSFIGGMRLGSFNASIPLVRLELFQNGFRLSSSVKILRGLIPTWEARFDELSQVQAIGKIPLWNQGIRFSIHNAHARPIFWSTHRESIMAEFAKAGVAIRVTPIRMKFLNPGDS